MAAKTLRAKIDMASGNMNMRDPAIYRIRKIAHQNTGDAWPIYPMYDYAHCLSDALEGITHSLCTLEFEDHRPLYDWFVDKVDLVNHPELWQHLRESGFRTEPAKPRQIEFSRLNLSYSITSKRKLAQLVNENLVDGWDDPRMNTLRGLRRRGFTPAGLRLLIERLGVSKQNSIIDYSILENCIREDLDATAPRRMAVLDPLKLVITNLPDGAPGNAGVLQPSQGRELRHARSAVLPRAVDRARGFRRSAAEGLPSPEARRRSAPARRRHREVRRDGEGCRWQRHRAALHARSSTSRHGLPGADRKVKGTIHWVSAKHGVSTEVRVYDRLFNVPAPDDESDGKSWIEHINPDAKRVVRAWLEPAAANAAPEQRFQFERLGYFVADRVDHRAEAPVFNRTVTLRDAWAKQAG